ncbi:MULTISPECIES: hypothetical protein [Streptomyces]|uniref:Uncharacterized protein n=1 Tax=Streptomyces melanosporofaciens TaxID=67327 RepID=A0A1H4ZEZ9_STRMJ|nr:hypothetical protein [Streptomyces melanosporofaciens]SED27950.1 hypothetical protein SAMN04490356_7777 [Streptomyces melanosporofaciens]
MRSDTTGRIARRRTLRVAAAEKQSGGGQAATEGGGRAHAGVERCRTENPRCPGV